MTKSEIRDKQIQPGKRKIRNNESFFNKIQYSMKKDTD